MERACGYEIINYLYNKMNIELLSTFQQNYPEEFDGILDCASMAVCCSFNKVGSLLAVGCSDGRLVIWDFLTKGIAKIISAHWSPIYSISWSKKSDLIATSSTDNTVCIWYTSTGRCRIRYCLYSPIIKIQFHPRNSSYLLICPMKHMPIKLHDDGTHQVVTIEDEPYDNNVTSTFDRKGLHIVSGNSRGLIMIKTFPDLQTISSFRVTTGANNNTVLRHIEFPRRGQYCLLNTSDRIIRIYSYNDMLTCGIKKDLEPKQKLQDLVNKSLWRKCCWSGDGEYICGASSRQHSLYIWETISGNLVKILHGTKGEQLGDVCWHPVRPIIASISSGVVSIWSHNQVENWSAFAPDFVEIEENVEYHERESEFDLKDEDKSVDGDQQQNIQQTTTKTKRSSYNQNQPMDDDNIEIDVVNEQRIEALVSSDDEDINDQLIYLPSAPDIDEPDVDVVTPQTPLPPSKPKTPTTPSLNTNNNNQIPLAAESQTKPRGESEQTYNIHLSADINDVHPYFGTKRLLPSQEGKREPRTRRALVPQSSLDSEGVQQPAIAQQNPPQTHSHHHHSNQQSHHSEKQPASSNNGQKAHKKSARLEGKKNAAAAAASSVNPTTSPQSSSIATEEIQTRHKRSHTHSSDYYDSDFISH
ncbi:unnamed protein product [Didymodactylos carnosus]|uniref:Uncharacterized protein n=1 Tax=Didymodactylos carnosus TaxID=1234261 RepID=A0A814I4Q3_9BILA|nr:unnamed protein product [Didymodactylos carnosus]CAF1018704.1 unnamed protein product [Didymodactylos carnosus]CAF3635122.1 unnamed protein product [Didymodactylos carnosus]CAF3790204.1 unnamed protein product [Didymodactylos carnosus]